MYQIARRREKFPRACEAIGYDDGRNIQDADKQFAYRSNRQALIFYDQGIETAKLCKAVGFTRQRLNVLLHRHERMGRRALVPGAHEGTRDPNLKLLLSDTPKANQLQALWKRFPWLEYTLRKAIESECLPASSTFAQDAELVSKDVINDETAYGLFLEQLAIARARDAAGQPAAPPSDSDSDAVSAPLEFPETSPNGGRTAFLEWVAKIREARDVRSQFEKERSAEAREEAFPRDGLGDYMFRCDVDGHYVDCNWHIHCPAPDGVGEYVIEVKRFWFIPIVEIRSGAILGYSWSLDANYDASDMCRAVRAALVVGKRRKLTLTTLAYGKDDMLPSQYDPALAGLAWDELGLDNHKGHLARMFLGTIQHSVGCILHFGPRAAPNKRPKIEKIFHLLEEAGFHKIPTTTGSHPDDPLSDHVKQRLYTFSLDVMLDVLDVFVCRWNSSCPSNSTIHRNEILKRWVHSRDALIRRVSQAELKRLERFDILDIAPVGRKGGKPVLRWQNGEYYGSCLSSEPGLYRKDLVVEALGDEPHAIQVSLASSGRCLGWLKVDARFASTPHSIGSRRWAHAKARNNRYSRRTGDILLAARRASTVRAIRGDKAAAAAAARFNYEQLGAGAKAHPGPVPASASPPTSAPSSQPVATNQRSTVNRSSRSGYKVPKAMVLTDEQRQRYAALGPVKPNK